MEQPTPDNQNRDNAKAMTKQTDSKTNASSAYPVAYFLCDGVTDDRSLARALMLPRRPRLRKARIAGYRRSVRTGDGPNTLVFDAQNFGEWSGEEVVKGVVFEAFCLEEELRLVEHMVGDGETKAVEIEVACPSLLGKVGKMMRCVGRIFVPEGDGDTLVGSARSVRSARSARLTEEVNMLISSGTMTEDREDNNDRFTDDDFSETGSMTAMNAHLIPRISSLISTFNDVDIPHRTLDEPPVPAVSEHLAPQHHQHPVDSSIETTDWDAKEVETTEVKHMKPPGQTQEVEKTEAAEIKESNHVRGAQGSEDHGQEIQEPDDDQEIDDIGVLTSNDRERIDRAERNRGDPFPLWGFGTPGVVETAPEEGAAATEKNSWTPTVPWQKLNATAPIRPAQILRRSSQFSGTTTRMRKTSDSIKSLVDHFENLSPQNTPSKDASKDTPSKGI